MIRAERSLPQELETRPKTAWIFPGLETQEVGMGRQLIKLHPLARQIYDQADKILSYPISQISFKGPDRLLNQTIYAQPAIFIFNHACLKILQEQRRSGFEQPAFGVTGHSLGEYNALVAAGCLNFQDGLRLVQVQAAAMHHACEVNPGGMFSVIGPLSEEDVTYLTERVTLEIAAFNAPDQLVFGGPKSALEKAIDWLKTKKVRVIRLRATGAFHTSLMEPAFKQFSKALEEIPIQDASIPVIANSTAKAIQKAEDIRQEVLNQLTKPVLWQETIVYLDEQGVERTIEVGQRRILTPMNKKIIGGVAIGTVATAGIAATILWHHRRQPS